jgi:hypothetical protein
MSFVIGEEGRPQSRERLESACVGLVSLDPCGAWEADDEPSTTKSSDGQRSCCGCGWQPRNAAAQGQPHTSETLRTESTGPQDPRSTSSVGGPSALLSEKLEITGGVIRPPRDIFPSMAVRPPVPDPGTTPVIPPPGTPGGDPIVEPK